MSNEKDHGSSSCFGVREKNQDQVDPFVQIILTCSVDDSISTQSARVLFGENGFSDIVIDLTSEK
jgi:hypothetical protein